MKKERKGPEEKPQRQTQRGKQTNSLPRADKTPGGEDEGANGSITDSSQRVTPSQRGPEIRTSQSEGEGPSSHRNREAQKTDEGVTLTKKSPTKEESPRNRMQTKSSDKRPRELNPHRRPRPSTSEYTKERA